VRRWPLVLAFAGVAVVLLVVARGAGQPAPPGPTPSTAVPGSPAPSGSGSGSLASVASPVEGIVVRIVATGLNEVQGFSILTLDGETIDFRMGPLVNAEQFPPGHLSEHQATSDPVRVYFEIDGGERVARRIDDVGG
jgi:hypothetical protein